jgi:2-phosphosulfolactate phosphatase
MAVNVDVYLTPSHLNRLEDRVCIVIDVLRASSSLIVMFERGIEEVVVAGSVEEARRVKESLGSACLLCGEVGGLPPPGFDYGNSPSEFSRLSLTGRRAIIATTNGSKLLAGLREAKQVLVGGLLNASAAAQSALTVVNAEQGIMIICAGDDGGTKFALADALGAGAIVAALAQLRDVELSDGAKAALAIHRTNEDDLASTLLHSEHGRSLAALGLAEDVSFCARKDVYSSVPSMHLSESGLLTLRAR